MSRLPKVKSDGHVPTKGWRCAQCEDEWPCLPAKNALTSTLSRRDVSIVISHYFRRAVNELEHEHGVHVLYIRFFQWINHHPAAHGKPVTPSTSADE